MQSRPNQGWPKLLTFWRQLVGVAAIYALAMQPLLLTVVGDQLAQAAAFDQVSFAQLCAHNADGKPVAPSDQRKHPAHQHCLQCFSGAFVLLDAPEPVTAESVDREFRTVSQSGIPLRLTSSSQYSVACPRGPPLSA
jgi:hypothetical protein